MFQNLVEKIISSHLVSGQMTAGAEIGILIDQTLTQDATGTMAYLQLEAIGVPRVKTKISVSYVDHNTLQTGFENADDHLYLQTVAARHGIYFSRPGNGICHQVHLERFGIPGMTLLGSDSHTPTGGGLGMLAIGAGGLDVAVAMGGGPFYLTMPQVIKVQLDGQLSPWVSAKDIILEVLRQLTVKGGVGKVIEYCGAGVATLSVPDRATITNMGAELGATSSVFPSDDQTRAFLRAQGREHDWVELLPDREASYDTYLAIDLSQLVPMVALPHSPDNVVLVQETGPVPVQQVAIGSCTNSSYQDLMKVAAILRGKTIHPDTSLVIAPGSRQVLQMLSANGALEDLIAAGARILETACGPCIGMGQAPPSGSNSVRTFNRNFPGRSGTADAGVYLTSPEVAAATALTGMLTDPRELGHPPVITLPGRYTIGDNMIIAPPEAGTEVVIRRGPNIKPLPQSVNLGECITGQLLLKVGNNITTDHIMPAGAKILPLRSNIPAIAQHVFAPVDPDFAKRAQAAGGGFILGGQNYGQGSSREHAALAPMYLGIKTVLALSFARIHRDNLINFGILPLTLAEPDDYQWLEQGDLLEIAEIQLQLAAATITVFNRTRQRSLKAHHNLTPRQLELIQAGGLLNHTRQGASDEY